MVSGAAWRISGRCRPAVAGVQPTPLANGSVVEIDVVGQDVHPLPADRLAFRRLRRTGSSIAALVQSWEWQVMQVSGRRQSGERRLLDRSMAVAAIDPD